MLALTDSVNLGSLPEESEKLRYQDYGMLDGVYSNDGCVRFDPRTATPDEGLAIHTAGVKNIVDVVNKTFGTSGGGH